jgi:NAD(P)-dependent dehydrogenase (short-subunit alcohol dehydrogenase family)
VQSAKWREAHPVERGGVHIAQREDFAVLRHVVDVAFSFAADTDAEAEKLDTSDFAASEAGVSAIAKRAGALDILVANAGSAESA